MTAAADRKLAKDQNEEYHDPFDDWGVRDILLSLVPMIVVFAFKDVALKAALSFAIAWSGWILLMRVCLFHGWRKLIWPVIDIFSVIMFAILRGIVSHDGTEEGTDGGNWYLDVWRWITLIIPLVYAVVAIISLAVRRPFTGHYARYPKFDRGGRELFKGDSAFRRTCDLTTLGWITAWSVMLLLTLVPTLKGPGINWYGWNRWNIVFNYCLPFIFTFSALVFTQLSGAAYSKMVARNTRNAVTGEDGRGAAFPAGAAGTPGVAGAHGVGATPGAYNSAV